MNSSHTGPLGSTLLASGEKVALRIWQDHTTDDKQPRRRDYEIVGYVASGEMDLLIENETRHLSAGDSFVIEARQLHSYQISKPATIIEATSPPARDALQQT